MKKSLTDRIEQYIKVLIDRSEENQIEIQRAELAETFACVPSQVTYVISTRFTEDEGYYTQSRRGGNGYVRITRYYHQDRPIISDQELFDWLDKMSESNLLTQNESYLIKHLFLHSLNHIPLESRNNYRIEVIEAVKNFIRKS
jgi:transcriptional regulator CtsR